MRPSCPCDFEMDELVPFSPAWLEAHRDHHLERFPDVDAGTRRVLDELIGWAERRDALGAPPARISGGGFIHERWCHATHPGWGCAAWRDEAERLDRCPTCEGLGYLLGQTYGFTELPEHAIPVQRCDTCSRYLGDVDAARAAAHDLGYVAGGFDADGMVLPVPGDDPDEDVLPGDVWVIDP